MRVGITRTEQQLGEIIEIAEKRDVKVVPLPLTEIQAIDFELPRGFNIGEDDWIIFTSANGVESFFKGMSRKPVRIPHSCRIAVVGKKTLHAVEEQGYDVSFVPSEPYGKTLFDVFIEQFGSDARKVMYARAETVQFDPEQQFGNAGIDYYPVVCYRSVFQTIDVTLVAGLTATDAILFTAPSAVNAYSMQFGQPIARPIAIGRTTAAEMEKLDWARVVVMAEPDIAKILEIV